MEEPEEEKTYEVKDKRRVTAEGELRDSEEAQTPKEQPAAEPAPEEHTGPEQLPQPSIYDLLQFVAGLIAEQAWLHMGLRLAPGQKEPTKDMEQAKLAIDIFAFIAGQLEPHVSDEDRRALQGIVSDLKINFVRQGQ